MLMSLKCSAVETAMAASDAMTQPAAMIATEPSANCGNQNKRIAKAYVEAPIAEPTASGALKASPKRLPEASPR
jgi:hypothetical protein